MSTQLAWVQRVQLTNFGNLNVRRSECAPNDFFGDIFAEIILVAERSRVNSRCDCDTSAIYQTQRQHSRGVIPLYTALAASSSPLKRVTEKFVSTKPGATSVTRIPVPTTSFMRDVPKARTALTFQERVQHVNSKLKRKVESHGQCGFLSSLITQLFHSAVN